MHAQVPAVIRLDTHLEGQNTIIYKDDDKLGNVQNKLRHTKLTAWFELNKNDPEANPILNHDIPKFYVWKAEKRIWSRIKSN